jgi:hypothetical protein
VDREEFAVFYTDTFQRSPRSSSEATAGGTEPSRNAHPELTIPFGPPLHRGITYNPASVFFVIFGRMHQSHFAGSLSAASIRTLSAHKPVPATESVNVSLDQQRKTKQHFHAALVENSQILN